MKLKVLPLYVVVGLLLGATPAAANLTGAIWTSLDDGTEVNFNIYDAKEDVYLNGGPGKGSGSNANGLPDGTYVFMVTDPSGKVLLSTDPAGCRRVQVINGVFDNVAVAGLCGHVIGDAVVGTPVQLIPYSDTPNNGGEYKAWLTNVNDYVCPLNVPSCDLGTFGFINSESKTDNFKVGDEVPDEIDTVFYNGSYAGGPIDGLGIRWIDTHGASNTKYSYYEPEHVIMHEAHVEAPEIGTHYIQIGNQAGCTVGDVYVGGTKQRKKGPQTIGVKVTNGMKSKGTFTVFVDVICDSQ